MSGRFNLNFLAQETTEEVNVEYYRPYFEDYSPEKWEAEVNGGAFNYFSDDGKEYSCLIAHDPQLGILVQFGIWDKESTENNCSWITVSDTTKLNKFIDVGSDELHSVGSFVSPMEAWKLVETFLINPQDFNPLEFKNLTDASKVPWPEY